VYAGGQTVCLDWQYYRLKSLAGKVKSMAALTEYLQAAMRHAEYERLDDGDWYAHIPGLAGLWASAKTVEDTRNDLCSALEDWLYVNAYIARLKLPEFDGVSIAAPPQRADS
jgi:predicted RNase H-like HicB family nuclease